MEGTVDTELTGDGSGISFKQTTDSLLMLRTDFHSRLNNHNIVFFFFIYFKQHCCLCHSQNQLWRHVV